MEHPEDDKLLEEIEEGSPFFLESHSGPIDDFINMANPHHLSPMVLPLPADYEGEERSKKNSLYPLFLAMVYKCSTEGIIKVTMDEASQIGRELVEERGGFPALEEDDTIDPMEEHLETLKNLLKEIQEFSSRANQTIAELQKWDLETKQQEHEVRRMRIPKKDRELLRSWLLEHKKYPYPSKSFIFFFFLPTKLATQFETNCFSDEKQELMEQTGLTLNQIDGWFANSRRRFFLFSF